MPPRPPILTVCAIIGIILGASGIFCQPIQTISLIAMKGQIEMPNLGLPTASGQTITLSTPLMIGMVICRMITVLYCGLLLASSVGALWLKPWARTGFLAYGIFAILNNLLYAVLSVIMSQQLLEASGSNPAAGAPPEIMFIGMACGGLCVFLVSIIYPIFALVTATRARVRQSFMLGYDPGLYAVPGAGPYPQPYDQPPAYGYPAAPPTGAPTQPPQQGGYTGPYYAQQDYYQQQDQQPAPPPAEHQPSAGDDDQNQQPPPPPPPEQRW